MSERKPGYYMIRYAHEQAPWEPAEWDGERWMLLGNSSSFSPATIGEVGPRIPTPDEPWRPENCRNELQAKGKPYPRSGCAVCGNGGLAGCPYEHQRKPEGE